MGGRGGRGKNLVFSMGSFLCSMSRRGGSAFFVLNMAHRQEEGEERGGGGEQEGVVNQVGGISAVKVWHREWI